MEVEFYRLSDLHRLLHLFNHMSNVFCLLWVITTRRSLMSRTLAASSRIIRTRLSSPSRISTVSVPLESSELAARPASRRVKKKKRNLGVRRRGVRGPNQQHTTTHKHTTHTQQQHHTTTTHNNTNVVCSKMGWPKVDRPKSDWPKSALTLNPKP